MTSKEYTSLMELITALVDKRLAEKLYQDVMPEGIRFITLEMDFIKEFVQD